MPSCKIFSFSIGTSHSLFVYLFSISTIFYVGLAPVDMHADKYFLIIGFISYRLVLPVYFDSIVYMWELSSTI